MDQASSAPWRSADSVLIVGPEQADPQLVESAPQRVQQLRIELVEVGHLREPASGSFSDDEADQSLDPAFLQAPRRIAEPSIQAPVVRTESLRTSAVQNGPFPASPISVSIGGSQRNSNTNVGKIASVPGAGSYGCDLSRDISCRSLG